jgi:hypothetical protein
MSAIGKLMYDWPVKIYLSSYKIGDQSKELQSFFSDNKSIGYIPNALDAWTSDTQKKEVLILSTLC